MSPWAFKLWMSSQSGATSLGLIDHLLVILWLLTAKQEMIYSTHYHHQSLPPYRALIHFMKTATRLVPMRRNKELKLFFLQVLTQEDWNIVLFLGMRKTSHWAALYFVALMTFGNYVLFNLLVAILVEGFSNQVRQAASLYVLGVTTLLLESNLLLTMSCHIYIGRVVKTFGT